MFARIVFRSAVLMLMAICHFSVVNAQESDIREVSLTSVPVSVASEKIRDIIVTSNGESKYIVHSTSKYTKRIPVSNTGSLGTPILYEHHNGVSSMYPNGYSCDGSYVYVTTHNDNYSGFGYLIKLQVGSVITRIDSVSYIVPTVSDTPRAVSVVDHMPVISSLEIGTRVYTSLFYLFPEYYTINLYADYLSGFGSRLAIGHGDNVSVYYCNQSSATLLYSRYVTGGTTTINDVLQRNDSTFVALADGRVVCIDENNNAIDLISTGQNISSIAISKGYVYTLSSSANQIRVYNYSTTPTLFTSYNVPGVSAIKNICVSEIYYSSGVNQGGGEYLVSAYNVDNDPPVTDLIGVKVYKVKTPIVYNPNGGESILSGHGYDYFWNGFGETSGNAEIWYYSNYTDINSFHWNLPYSNNGKQRFTVYLNNTNSARIRVRNTVSDRADLGDGNFSVVCYDGRIDPTTMQGTVLIATVVELPSNSTIKIAPNATILFSDSGKIIVPSNTTLEFESCTGDQEYTKVSGQSMVFSDAIEVQSGGQVIGKHVKFENLPCAIQIDGGKVKLDSAEFVDCNTALAVLDLSDSVSISHSTFSGSTTQISAYSGDGSAKLSLTDCSFDTKETTEKPTVIVSGSDCNLSVDGCTFASSDDSPFCGITSIYDHSLSVTNTALTSTVNENSGIWAAYTTIVNVDNVDATGYFYGITCSTPTTFTMDSCSLNDCHVGYYLGLLSNQMELSNCSADNCDYGTYQVSCQAAIADVDIKSSSVMGAILFDSNPLLKSTLFDQNATAIQQNGSSQIGFVGGSSSQFSNSTNACILVHGDIYPLADYANWDFENDAGTPDVPFIDNETHTTSKPVFYLRSNFWSPKIDANNYSTLFTNCDPGQVVFEPQDGSENYVMTETLDDEDLLYLSAIRNDTSGAASQAAQEYRNYLSWYPDSAAAPVVVNRLWLLDVNRQADLHATRSYLDSLALQLLPLSAQVAKLNAMRSSRELGEFDDAILRLAQLYVTAQNHADTLAIQLEELELYYAIAISGYRNGQNKRPTVNNGFAALAALPGGTVAAPKSFTEYKIAIGSKLDEFAKTGKSIPPVNSAIAEIPSSFALHPVYPNPFNPIANIRFDLPEASQVRVSVYDATGRLVTNLVDGNQNAGYHNVQWNGSSVSSGVYFVTIHTNKYTATRKAVLLK